ncbi:hypothetical protein, partial [Vibrio cholerae]
MLTSQLLALDVCLSD